MNTMIAVLAALVSVGAYAAGAAVQHRVATTTRRPLTSGAWWVAVALNTAGAALHVAALVHGPLTLVQPIGALTLVAAVPLGARAAGRRVTGQEWHGIVLILTGFAALLPLTAGGGAMSGLGTAAALGVTAAAGLSVLFGRSGPLGYAAASGVASAAGSALTRTVLHAELSWRTLLLGMLTVALAVGGLLLSQTAYAGGLGAPLATLTLTNPVASAAIGIVLLGERTAGGLTGAAVAAAGAVVAVRGVILLTGRGSQSEKPCAANTSAPVFGHI